MVVVKFICYHDNKWKWKLNIQFGIFVKLKIWGKWLEIQIIIQCLQSSLSQNGGDNLRHHCSAKFQMTLKACMGRSQLLPKIFETVLRPIWWAAGCEQPSPPLHRATAAQLLSWSGALLLLFFGTSISWRNPSCISHWANHISAGEWSLHCICFLTTPVGLNCCQQSADAHTAFDDHLYLS